MKTIEVNENIFEVIESMTADFTPIVDAMRTRITVTDGDEVHTGIIERTVNPEVKEFARTMALNLIVTEYIRRTLKGVFNESLYYVSASGEGDEKLWKAFTNYKKAMAGETGYKLFRDPDGRVSVIFTPDITAKIKQDEGKEKLKNIKMIPCDDTEKNEK